VIDLSAANGYEPEAVESMLACKHPLLSIFSYSFSHACIDMYTDDYPRKPPQQKAPPAPVLDPLLEMAAALRSQNEPVSVHLNGVGDTAKPSRTSMPGVVGVGSARHEMSPRESDADPSVVDPLLHVQVFRIGNQ